MNIWANTRDGPKRHRKAKSNNISLNGFITFDDQTLEVNETDGNSLPFVQLFGMH